MCAKCNTGYSLQSESGACVPCELIAIFVCQIIHALNVLKAFIWQKVNSVFQELVKNAKTHAKNVLYQPIYV